MKSSSQPAASAIPDSVKQRLVCPVCKGGLTWHELDAEPTVECMQCGRVYPFQDGIPVLLRERSRMQAT
jgi:uncharacterized protein YbaR (Trm112 family)